MKTSRRKAEDFIQDLHTSSAKEYCPHSGEPADSEIEILKEELASLKLRAVAAAGRGTGRGKQGGARGTRNHATVGRGHSTETCTKCGKVGHVTAQCFQTGDELPTKAEAMVKEAATILTKRKTSHKVNDDEVKSYSAGCVANKDDKEYVSRASVVLPIHRSPTTKLTSPSSIVIYHGHLSPTQITTKKNEGSVACSAILDQKFVPDTGLGFRV
jgi:hypothetical protein